MNDAPPRASDARLDDLERAMRALEARLTALEGAPERPIGSAVSSPIDEEAAVRAIASEFDAIAVLSLVGRTLMVLGGAYLLRALTESGIWPASIGVALGFAYAAGWLAAALQSARSDRWISAEFHGATAVMLALPLLWEAVTRFHLMDAVGGSVSLSVITMVALLAAVRARLQSVAWLAVGGFIAASLALTAVTGAVLPFTVADIVVGIVTLWIGYTVDWIGLRWPIALTADVAVLALGIGATSRTASSSPAAIVAVQLVLPGAYVVSVAIRTLVRGREVIPFEALQSTVALLIGFGGAIAVAQITGMGIGLLVSSGIAGGVGCYAVAFAFIARRQGVRRNFYFYTSMGLVLVAGSTAVGLAYPAMWWAALAVLAARTAARRATGGGSGQQATAPGWLTLTVHAASYLAAAFLASGLVAASFRALVGPPIAQSPAAPQSLVVFGAGCLCWMILARSDPGLRSTSARIPRAVIALLLAIAGGGWLAALVLSDGTTAGNAATLRTIALAATALALASLGRAPRLREAAWLVYPTLAAGGLKLLAEDFAQSSAATLFVALAIYGGVLIAAPRLIRSPSGASS